VKLWDFAVAIHGEPGVDAGLIALQDHHGQCVSYLLWAVWAARHGRAVGEAELALAVGLARDWEAEVAGPLRAVRRTLKRPWLPMAAAKRKALRTRVKASELAAERTLLEALDALTPRRRAAAVVAQRLHAAMEAWSGLAPAPVPALETLLPIFERFAI
jgi:uncharacterized protein (TIGR02444 family)